MICQGLCGCDVRHAVSGKVRRFPVAHLIPYGVVID